MHMTKNVIECRKFHCYNEKMEGDNFHYHYFLIDKIIIPRNIFIPYYNFICGYFFICLFNIPLWILYSHFYFILICPSTCPSPSSPCCLKHLSAFLIVVPQICLIIYFYIQRKPPNCQHELC